MYSSRNVCIRRRSYIITATTTARICDDVFKSLLRLAGRNSYALQCMDWDDTPRSGDSQLCLRLSLGELWRHIFRIDVLRYSSGVSIYIREFRYFYPVTYHGIHSEKTSRNYRILFSKILCLANIVFFLKKKKPDFFFVMIFFSQSAIYRYRYKTQVTNIDWDAASRTVWRAQTVLACWNFVTDGFHDVPEFRESPEFHDETRSCVYRQSRRHASACVHAIVRSIPPRVLITCTDIDMR